MKAKRVCVFCASSNEVPAVYAQAARELGKELAAAGLTLVYGGTNVGLMGLTAQAVLDGGGKVLGVIPTSILDRILDRRPGVELVQTAGLEERKAVMIDRSDAFVVLPGGFGTLDEVFQVLALKIFGVHNKPVVFVNTDGFYDDLQKFFDRMFAEHFAKPACRELYRMVGRAGDVVRAIEEYNPPKAGQRWF